MTIDFRAEFARVHFFRPWRDLFRYFPQPTVDTVGYFRSSLMGLQIPNTHAHPPRSRAETRAPLWCLFPLDSGNFSLRLGLGGLGSGDQVCQVIR
jgi:hypothetical protein